MSPRILVTLLAVSCAVSAQSDVENQAREFLDRFDKEASDLMYQYSLASWAYNTDITQENADKEVSTWKTFTLKCGYFVTELQNLKSFSTGRTVSDLGHVLQQDV